MPFPTCRWMTSKGDHKDRVDTECGSSWILPKKLLEHLGWIYCPTCGAEIDVIEIPEDD